MSSVKLVATVLLLAASFVNAQDYVDECPEPNGLYADAVQCDRYYECKNGQISDKLCPDGLVFDESSIQFAKCSFPFSVDCSDRPELQKAKPTPFCPRRNGYFSHENPHVCDQFYFCVDGVENKITCPESLIFNPKNGQCAYSDQIERQGCSSQDFFKFSCPDNPNSRHAHPRYPDPLDCQYFYLCINGNEARRNGCQTGFVFNQATSSCDRQDKLDEGDRCRNWYNETVLEDLRGPAGSPILPVGVKKSGTGIALDTKNRKRVQVVRRKRPRPSAKAAQPAEAAQLPNTPRRVLGGSRVAIDAGFRTAQEQQQRVAPSPTVRTRVRRPPLPGFQPERQPEESTPRGPPQFALSDAEAIQRFRDQNQFVPQLSGNGGRLTVLSSSGAAAARPEVRDPVPDAPRPTPFTVFNRNRGSNRQSARPRPVEEQEEEEDQLFAQEAPESGFGNRNRFRSRRPPPPSSRSPDSDQIRQLPVRRNPPQQQSRSRGSTQQPSRGRLEVSQINVEPQFDLGQDSPNFSSFPSFDSARQ